MAEPEKTEKVTVNLGVVDLGEIDLLVREGFEPRRVVVKRFGHGLHARLRGLLGEERANRAPNRIGIGEQV